MKKVDFPVHNVRHFLEPGPVVLISSASGKETDIMTLGWHTILEFSPSLVGCMISAGNHSHQLIRNSGECVINLPTSSLLDTVVAIGNCSGEQVDKLSEFSLTAGKASKVKAPLIKECHACFECKLYDDSLVDNFNFFIFEVVKAHVAPSPAQPETVHYCGDGEFMLSGKHVSRRSQFRPEML
ncbi:flavin reductase family protein [Pantoea sp. BAV 3049]|uniref:flavin reductase family protein n=1 Tax=Pantoea sp. BAV 3049 TaxID=2654188 RepID=UPI0018EED494|nr:flavin reductase family protein [Pantoea sp. BAV 3049]